jgi:hypothetical protein
VALVSYTLNKYNPWMIANNHQLYDQTGRQAKAVGSSPMFLVFCWFVREDVFLFVTGKGDDLEEAQFGQI